MAEEAKVNWMDRAIASVAPRYAMSRVMGRSILKEFESGEVRQRGDSGGKTRHAASETSWRNRDRLKQIWEARDMEERYCFVRGILEKLTQYVCGSVTYQARTGDSEIDEQYQTYFHDWCGRCDITGRFRFSELVQLGFRATVRDGEHGWLLVPMDGELRLQSIEADRIGGDEPRSSVDEHNINGIIIDDYGRVERYEIYKRSRMSQYTKEMEATPEQFIHLYRPTRVDQYHGISWLSAGLPHARDIHELYGFEKIAMKFAAAFAGFIKRPDGLKNAGMDWLSRKPGGDAGPGSFAVQPGLIKRLQDGEEISFPGATGRPSGNLMQFVELLIREMALGLNLPFGFVYNMALLGGVTARIEVMQAMRSIAQMQQMLVDRVLNRVRDAVIDNALAMGALTPHPLWNAGSWNFGARLTGDTSNYVSEQIMLMQNGLITRGKVIEEMDGSSHMEIARTRAREVKELQEVGAESGVPIELVVPALSNATALLAAINSPPEPPPQPPPGYVGQAGEKTAAQVIEVLTAYAEGKLERESALQSLVWVYGVPRARAESLIPEQRPEQPNPNSNNANSNSASSNDNNG
jgi:lambda family phage portal protein